MSQEILWTMIMQNSGELNEKRCSMRFVQVENVIFLILKVLIIC